jgi:hypothetical protein
LDFNSVQDPSVGRNYVFFNRGRNLQKMKTSLKLSENSPSSTSTKPTYEEKNEKKKKFRTMTVRDGLKGLPNILWRGTDACAPAAIGPVARLERLRLREIVWAHTHLGAAATVCEFLT